MFLASILYSAILIGQNSPQVSPPTATPVRPPSVKANSKKSLNFDNDVRLKVKTTLKANEMTHVSLWEHIAFKAKVKIEREAAANEFDDSPLVLCCNDVSIHDLMDSVAARVLARWETIPKGYRFLVSSNELDFAYMPKDEKQREFFRKGMAFAKEIQKLPQETQQRFAVGESVPYGSFNPAMQSFVRDLAHSIGEDVLANAAPGSRLGVDITDLSDAGMKVVKVPAEGFDSYNITFSKPGMSGTFSVNNYEQRRAEGMQPGVKGGAGSLYAPKKHDLKHEDAKERPLLKKVVSIQIGRASCRERV